MMYHLSSHLQGIQIVCPETKPNLSYKEKWVRLLQEDISLFCELYASCDIAQVMQRFNYFILFAHIEFFLLSETR